MRADSLLVMASALLLGGCAVVAPLPVGVAALVVAALLCRRIGMLAWLSALAALGASTWRARAAVEAYEADRVAARDAIVEPSRCAARAVIVESPIWIRGSFGLVADLYDTDCEGRALPSPVRARLYGGPDNLGRGDVLEVIAKLAPVRLFRNRDLPDPTPRVARSRVVLSGRALSVHVAKRSRGLRALIDAGRAHARRRIQSTFSARAAPLARALVLGESDLPPEDDAAFKRSGLAHLLAVSGTHLVFAVVVLVQALRSLLVRIEWLAARMDVGRFSAVFGAVLALVYADYAGGSGSAWRAAYMLAGAYGARAAGRHPSAGRALGASLAAAAILDPLAAFDISLLLSAAATVGLLVLGRPCAVRLAKVENRLLRFGLLSVVATVASMLPCAPLLAMLSDTLSVAGIFANVIAVPFGEVVALPLCLSHALLTPFAAVERGVGWVASAALLVVRRIALGSASVHWLAFEVPVPGAWHVMLIGVGVTGAILSAGGAALRPARVAAWLGATAIALGGVELAQAWVHRPLGELRIAMLDVGQGDAALVDLPDGRLMLVDGGGFQGGLPDPGARVILPLLRARRRSRIDLAVLTHPHPDHVGGLATVLRAVEVGELWDSGQGEAEGAPPSYGWLLHELRSRKVPIRRPGELCGRPRHFGPARVDVLGPCPGFFAGLNANDNSLILRITLGQRVALLVGDAERTQEARLLRRHRANLTADLLKVGHHGSATSSSAPFLMAVRPRLAAISSGVRNRFGHPHRQALARLLTVGATPLRTDRVGSVEWRTDGDAVRVRTFSEPR